MHPSPPTVLSAFLLLAALILVVWSVVTVRPRPPGLTVETHAAPGPKPRMHERVSSARRTKRRGAGPRTARPAARSTPEPPVLPPEAQQPAAQVVAVTPPPQPPETVVERYYRALDAGRFDAAWTILTPAVRSAFGGFERWRDGFATTLSNSPRGMEVAREGAAATVAHELVTEDRSPCGPIVRRFAIRWRFVLAGDGWRAASLTGVKRAGPGPDVACAARHDARDGAGGR